MKGNVLTDEHAVFKGKAVKAGSAADSVQGMEFLPWLTSWKIRSFTERKLKINEEMKKWKLSEGSRFSFVG